MGSANWVSRFGWKGVSWRDIKQIAKMCSEPIILTLTPNDHVAACVYILLWGFNLLNVSDKGTGKL